MSMASISGRWSYRLSRGARISTPTASTTRPATHRPITQSRWVHKPAPRSRAWATVPKQENAAQATPHVQGNESHQQTPPASNEPGPNQRLAATLAETASSDLVSEVRIPDDPHGVLPPDHPALTLLGNSSLVIQRQIEFMNIMLGFEQANRYIIMDGQGQTIGYIAERDHGIGSAMARQMFKTHRSFTTHIFDREEKEVLRIHRPFAYINSRIRIYDPVPAGGYEGTEASTALQGTSAKSAVDQGSVAQVSPLQLEEMRIIGEASQQWAPLRRKYNLFGFRPLAAAPDDANTPRLESGDTPNTSTTALTESKVPDAAIEAGMKQFAHVNEPFLSWDFHLKDEQQNDVGSVNRSFSGFAREIFTDTGVYALRMDSVIQTSESTTPTAMTLDQRAVMLATAVSIDFDYFSRHSGSTGGVGFMPMMWPMGGGTAAGEGAAGAGAAGAGAAGAAGVGEAGAVGAAEGAGAIGGAATRGVGAAAGSEGAIAGAGTMAGYEAMQRGAYGPRGGDDASPQSDEPIFDPDGTHTGNQPSEPPQESSWWNDDNNDSWGGGGSGNGPPPSAGGEGGGGGSWTDAISDFFGD